MSKLSDMVLKFVEQISREVRGCTKCELHEGRKNAVPGEGNVSTKMMFIGEAPGREEDLQGRPFVGTAGKLLSQLLASINLSRQDVYITNIVKCRPPKNRPPRVGEISACSSYLERQIRLIDPKVICLMGNTALKVFLGKDISISRAHGQPARMANRVIFPLYHPAAVLYDAKLRSVLEEDFKRVANETR